MVTVKAHLLKGGPTVTTAERARVETMLPYNLDAWDGYLVESEMVFAAATGEKLVYLAGDTHNAWCSTLTDVVGKKSGIESASASVSSPGFEAIFGNNLQVIAGVEQAFATLIDNLK